MSNQPSLPTIPENELTPDDLDRVVGGTYRSAGELLDGTGDHTTFPALTPSAIETTTAPAAPIAGGADDAMLRAATAAYHDAVQPADASLKEAFATARDAAWEVARSQGMSPESFERGFATAQTTYQEALSRGVPAEAAFQAALRGSGL